MKIGDVVRNKHTGEYGTVEYSLFGCSIHTFDAGKLQKTLGDTFEEMSKDWEVVELPEGYKRLGCGGIVKKDMEA